MASLAVDATALHAESRRPGMSIYTYMDRTAPKMDIMLLFHSARSWLAGVEGSPISQSTHALCLMLIESPINVRTHGNRPPIVLFMTHSSIYL